MKTLLKAFARDERGVSAMEYAVIATAAVVAVGAIGVGYQAQIATMFTTLTTQASHAQTGN